MPKTRPILAPAKKSYISRAATIGRIQSDLRQRVGDGVWEPGTLIPSRRVLAEEFGVDLSTVRRATLPLIDEGMLRVDRRGTFVPVGTGGTVERSPMAGLMNHTVAVLTPFSAMPMQTISANGWGITLTNATLQAVYDAGLHAIVLHPDRLQNDSMAQLVANCPYGIICGELSHDLQHLYELLAAARDASVPVVVYGDGVELAFYDRVVSDHVEGAYQLTKWLIGTGRKRLLNVWPAPSQGYWFGMREAGTRRAIAEAGLEFSEPITVPNLYEFNTEREGFAAKVRVYAGYLAEYLVGRHDPCDALMVSTDGDVYIVAAACRMLGKEPGVDVVIAGYDNYWADVTDKDYERSRPVATVDKQNAKIGAALAQLLFERIHNNGDAAPRVVSITPELVVTASDP